MRTARVVWSFAFAGALLAGCTAGTPAQPSPSGGPISSASTATPVPVPAPTGTPAVTPTQLASNSGVQGRTMVDAGCPAAAADSPCPDKPLSARIAVTRAGTASVVATAVSDAFGHFRIALPPGRYVVYAFNLTGARYPRGASVNLVVRAGRYTPVTVRFDSGIRYQGNS